MHDGTETGPSRSPDASDEDMSRTELRPTLVLLTSIFLLPVLVAQFVAQGLPAFMRLAGHPAETIGLVILAGLPFTLSFLWAPMVDRYGWSRFGYRRGWLLGTQAAILVGLLSFLLLDPAVDPLLLILVAAVLMGLIGTYMAAAGGWMLDRLPKRHHASGAAAHAAARGAGGVVLGLGILYFLGDLGWVACVLALACTSLLGWSLIAARPMDRGVARPPRDARPSLFANLAIFKRREVLLVFFFVQLMDLGIVLTFALRPILQVDAGFSLSEIGLLGVVGGNAVGMIGAVAATPVIKRLGAVGTLAIVALAALLMNGVVAFGLASGGASTAVDPGLTIFYVLTYGFLGFAGFTAGRTLFLGLCAEGRHATDFMTLLSVDAAAALMMAGFGSAIAGRLGLAATFAVAAVAAALACLAAALLRSRRPDWP